MAQSTVVARHIEGASVGWRFWLKWFLACLAGFVVGIPLFIGLGILLGDQPGPAVVQDAVTGVIHRAEFGIAQWLLLRRQVHKVGWWVGASIVGFMIGFPLTKTLFGELSSGLVVAGGAGAVVGAVAGALQWLVLRGRVGRAGGCWRAPSPGWSARFLAKLVRWPLVSICGRSAEGDPRRSAHWGRHGLAAAPNGVRRTRRRC